MKTHTWTAMALVAALTVVALPARASQRDWARAGRILTGYVVFRTLVGDPLRLHARHRPVAYEPYPFYGYTPYTHGYTYGHRAYPRPYVRRSRTQRIPPGDPPERWDSQAPFPAPTAESDASEPMIVPLRDGRRLYQPTKAGSPSYVQVWSEEEQAWHSVARMPPLR